MTPAEIRGLIEDDETPTASAAALELLLAIVEALAKKKHSNDGGILLPSALQEPTLDSLIERSRAALDMPNARKELAQ